MNKNEIYKEVYSEFKENDFDIALDKILKNRDLLIALIGCVVTEYSDKPNNQNNNKD